METNDGAFAHLRVALLDDNRNFQILLRTMLRHFGFRRIESFSTPADAMTHVCDSPIDLAFVDLVMPGQNGIEWARAARRMVDVANPEMAIVLVTGRVDHHVLDGAVAAGIDDVLAKPLSPETLLRHIRMVLARPRPYVRNGGYYGPEVGPALRRLRETHHPKAPVRRAPFPAPVAAPVRAPRRSVPGLDVEIRAPVEYHGEATFLD